MIIRKKGIFKRGLRARGQEKKNKAVKLLTGFTLLETLVYVAVFSIVMAGLVSFLVWAVNTHVSAVAAKETLYNAQRAMRVIIYEIKEAESIYIPTTVSNQLSLETAKYLPAGEESAYIDFFLCDSRLCLKKEDQNPVVITSDNIEITNIIFTIVNNNGFLSVQINITAEYKNPSGKSEYEHSVNLVSTASLRI